MKAAFVILLSVSFFTVSLPGQSARELVKKTVPKDQRTPPPAPSSNPAKPANQSPPAKAATPVVREKTKEEKAEIEKKTIEFQTKRAEEGSASAQYDLGIRFLAGTGVEKNEETARKWLNAAAQQGNTSAIKKLQELDKK